MSEKIMYVKFNKDTGKVTGVTNEVSDSDTYIQTTISEVMSLIDGTEMLSNYIVQYNPKTKDLELKSKYDHVLDALSVKDFIYEVPELADADADVQLVQDIPNTCWKVKIGNTLKKNIRQKGVNLNTTVLFSITEKGDPNILYKTLSVHLSQALSDNYYIIPFDMSFETSSEPVSVYTSRRFDTYQFERIYE